MEDSMGYLAAIGSVLAIAACTIVVRHTLNEPLSDTVVATTRDRLIQKIDVPDQFYLPVL